MSSIRIQTDRGETIVGILEKKEDLTQRLVLFAHSLFGHKDALYQPLLAKELPFSSFRFDFRGHGESEGRANYANITEDTEDLHTVAQFFKDKGYTIFAVLGHSQGALAALKYATTCEIPLSHCVNISGWYSMSANKVKDYVTKLHEAFDRQGTLGRNIGKRDKNGSIDVTSDDVEKFTSWDNSHIRRMPKTTCVLTCHGLNDTIVPPQHAAVFANMISNHTLRLIPNADHNFSGKAEEIVQTIVDYFVTHEQDAYEKAVAMGQHVSLCIPRWIDVEGVKNFRDLGGWPLKDGSGYIRERVIFRCGHLTDITTKGIEILRQLNVIAAFDFRSDPEIERQGVMPDIPGLTRHHTAVFSKTDYSPAALAMRWKGYFEGPTGFPKVYKVILEKGSPQYRRIFLHLLEHHPTDSKKSLIVHCTAGKDRTGLFGMLLLGLCGVDDEIIAHEYALTNLGYWEPEQESEEKAKLLGVTIEDMRMVMSAPYLAMKETIRLVNETYGSIEGYVRNECRLTTEQIESVRDLMIVPIRFEERQLFRPKI
ncbi:hypothetical protein DFQ28_002856 [Apophysomyces sp. BC1034]|nr:hypothetical protein DFQ30_003211 [Apophysomyces sp. BC1015]KAG0179371.1 hypothetical protein DFQ29_002157 [Apophysomyces sp. BC1021]KAG0189811.1 hypothetical protein DFQ28_002856 [Apophysomyces sp. BC1034]